MTKRSARGRSLAGDDDAIPVRVYFEPGWHHAEILHTVLHSRPALRQERNREGAQMVFRRQGEGHAGRPAALVYVRGSPPLADDLTVIASDRDHVMLPQLQGVLADLMTPKEEIGARGEVGSLRLHREVGHHSREVVVT